MLFGDAVIHGGVFGEEDQGGHHERHGRETLTDHDHESVHRGEPVGFERHQVIDGAEGHEDEEQRYARCAERLQFVRVFGGLGFVFELRPFSEQQGQDAKEDRINNPAAPEEGYVQIEALRVDDFIGHTCRGSPPVDFFVKNEQRQKQRAHDVERFSAGFEGTADDQAPRAAGDELRHQDQQAGCAGAEP